MRTFYVTVGSTVILTACTLLPLDDLDAVPIDGSPDDGVGVFDAHGGGDGPSRQHDAGAEAGRVDARADAPHGDATTADHSAPEGGAGDSPAPDSGTDACSTHLLSDENNCGACGHVCCGAVCADGGCDPTTARKLESPSNLPNVIAVDPAAGSIYWSHVDADGGSSVVAMDKQTLARKELASGFGNVSGIAVSSDAVFVVDNTNGAVLRVAKSGGSRSTIASGEIAPRQITTDATHLWWTEAGFLGTSMTGVVHAALLDGTSPASVYSSRIGPQGIAVSGATLVWTEDEVDDVIVGATSGSTPVVTVSGEQRAHDVVIAGSDVYWTDYATTQVRTLTLGGTATSLATVPADNSPAGIAVDGTYVYWLARSQNGSLWATRRDDTTTTQFGPSGLACPTEVAIDDACVYWVEEGACNYPADSDAGMNTGRVMRIDKPQ